MLFVWLVGWFWPQLTSFNCHSKAKWCCFFVNHSYPEAPVDQNQRFVIQNVTSICFLKALKADLRLSILLSTFLSFKLPQNSLLNSEHSMTFYTQSPRFQHNPPQNNMVRFQSNTTQSWYQFLF